MSRGKLRLNLTYILGREKHNVMRRCSAKLQTTKQTYTCQLFLRYKREIFILGVLGFLRHDHFRRFPKKSEVLGHVELASLLPVLFTSKIRDCEEGIVIYSFYTWFLFLIWVRVNIFLETVPSHIFHIFQSGVRNWPTSVSRREIEVFNPRA